jgi:intein/homing endonuclease
MQNFSENVLQMLKEHSGIMRNKTDIQYFKEYLTDRKKWRYPRVSIDTFLDDNRYLGIGDYVYPKVREMCRDIIEKGYSEAVIVAGIGAGKTTVSEILACYATHYLLCLRNPHATYYLAKDKPITIMNMGTTATQALENCFTGIRNLMEKSPWFKRFNPKVLTTNIRFSRENILLVSGNSKSTTPLGYNIFYAVLDEAAFYMDNENKQIAEEIYNALQRRIVSRFGNDGLVVMISSPRYEGDFIMNKLEDAKKFPDLIYHSQIPTWKTRPLKQADMANKFYFHSRDGLVDDKPDLSNKADICFVTDEFISTKTYWEVPGEYKKSFLQDPDKAKRDFAALPSMTIEAFMAHPHVIKTMFDESIDTPLQSDGKYKFAEPALRTSYYIHIDLALNKKGKGDHAGFAMTHFDGWEENEITGERQKKIVVDLAERISAGVTGEINFEEVRNKIYALKAMGYSIKLVTLDQFQCLRSGTKIPVTTSGQFQSLIYNNGNNTKDKNMSLLKETELSLLKGEDKKIEDIKPGEYVYSINKKGDVGFGKVRNVWSSGKKKIFRVHLDNGKHIDCSDNHPFMLRDGSFKQVKDLKVGESLMPLYRKKGMKDLKDYEMVLHSRGSWEYTHRAIMRQKKEIERGKVIHHKNRDKRNNEPINLESLSYKEHGKLHRDLAIKGLEIAREKLSRNTEAQERRNKALAETSRRIWKENPDRMKKALAKGNKKRWRRQEEHEKISKIISERNRNNPVRKGTETSKDARKNMSEMQKKLWSNEQHRKKMAKRKTAHYGEKHPMYDSSLTIDLLKQNTGLSFSEVCKKLNTTARKVRNRINKQGFRYWKEFCETVNHKIIKIEDLGIEDAVWDIEVEENHNFATSAGVFVHNSADTLQILRSKGIRAEYLSVDRTIEPYNTLKELIYSKRVKCHKMDFLFDELQRLEITKSNKVDHPPGGCFTGETRVALADGTNPTFKELSERNDAFYVYSMDKNGVSIKKARNARVTKTAKELVEVTLDNFQVVRCTPEHLFMTLDGEWVKAQNLTPDISIMPLYRTRSYKGGYADYERVWCPIRKKRLLTHQLAVGGCSKGKVVHHKDEVKWNNDPRNLEVMSRTAHYKHHGNKLWSAKEGLLRKGHEVYRKDKVAQKVHSDRMRAKWSAGNYGKRVENCSMEGCVRISNARGLCDMHYQRAKRAKMLPERTSSKRNHRILAVKKITTNEDVYDLTVPETENFALASGVFVHNSKDVADAVCGAVYNAIQNSGGEMGMMQTNSSEVNTADKRTVAQQRELSAKEKYYKQLQGMLDAGVIQ